MLRGLIQISTEGKSIALRDLPKSLGLQGLRRARSSAFRCRFFWVAAVRRRLLADLQPPPLRRARPHRRRQSRCRPADGHQRQAACGCRPSSSSASAPSLAGVFAVFINYTWWPTSGDSYLLPGLASVFVGGTAPWGGIGTVIGSAIGAFTVSFIQTGRGRRGTVGLLRAVLLRPDHHPVAARPSLEPGPLPLGRT